MGTISTKPRSIQWPLVERSVESIDRNFDDLFTRVADLQVLIGDLQVRNAGTVAIPKGYAVYLAGGDGTYPTVGLAKADALATMPAIGLATNAIQPNDVGTIKSTGLLSGLDTSGLNVGDKLYVSAATAGLLTATKPTTNPQQVGVVMLGAVEGILSISLSSPSEIHALLSGTHSDTTTGTVARGDLVTGQGASATWTRLAKGSADTFLRSDGTDLAWSTITLGTNTVGNYTASVAGTTNRIGVTGAVGEGQAAVVDIAGTYVGQTSITTLGTITTGTWNASDIALGTYTSGNYTASVAGTASRILVTGAVGEGQAAVIDIDGSYSGQTSITILGTISTGIWNATAITLGTYTSGNYTASVAGTTSRIAVSGAVGEGQAAVVDIDGAYVGQTSITTLGTIGTGTWNATTISVAKGGTGITASGTAGNYLRSDGAAWASSALQAGDIPAHAHAETDITDGTVLARVAGNEAITGAWTFSEYMVYTGSRTIGNSTIVSNDLAVTSNDFWIQYSDNASDSINNITGGTAGQILVFSNISSVESLTLNHNGGAAGSEIYTSTGANITLSPNDSAILMLRSAGWQMIALAQ